jgi:hypothetical protein
MILLTTTNDIVQVVTTSTATTDYAVGWVDLDDTVIVGPGSGQGVISSATSTTIVAAPSSGQQRKVQSIWITNTSTTTANTVTVVKDVSGTDYRLYQAVLAPGESVHYTDGVGFSVRDTGGKIRTQAHYETGYTGRAAAFFKLGTGATEAAGIRYLQSRDTGSPGTWSVGTPGLNGRATDGTAAADAGCLPYANAGTGENYLNNFNMSASSTGVGMLIDIVWVNTAIVVTTTTAQALTSVAFPARDVNGSSNGEGYEAAILVTTATTNAGAITNTTLNYTDSDGNATNTGTIASFPATCTAGSFVPFQLAAGDRGVRSIQGVTLGTSYGGGAISLIVYRVLAMVPLASAWIPGTVGIPSPGIRLYDGSCLMPAFIPTSATTFNTSGWASWVER